MGMSRDGLQCLHRGSETAGSVHGVGGPNPAAERVPQEKRSLKLTQREFCLSKGRSRIKSRVVTQYQHFGPVVKCLEAQQWKSNGEWVCKCFQRITLPNRETKKASCDNEMKTTQECAVTYNRINRPSKYIKWLAESEKFT